MTGQKNKLDYLKSLIKNGKTTVMSFSEFVSVSSDVTEKEKLTAEKFMSKYKLGDCKVVVRRMNVQSKSIIYWAPCDFSIMVLVSSDSNIVAPSFIGKDIKRAALSYITGKDKSSHFSNEMKESELKEAVDNFSMNYIKNEYPISDNVFYNLSLKKNTILANTVIKPPVYYISCVRNYEYSPNKNKSIRIK